MYLQGGEGETDSRGLRELAAGRDGSAAPTGRRSPPDVVGQQREVETQREPLGRAEEHDAEEEVDEVLWQHQLEGRGGDT